MKSDQIARRKFLSRVGKGMIVATVGTTVAEDLGIATATAAESDPKRVRLTFGEIEPLVSMLQETPAERLQPLLVAKLRDGSVSLPLLVKAAALSNARAFGGEDYIGMHTLMALKPAYRMSQQLPTERRALAILKVLHRNTSQIQTNGGVEKEVLHPVIPDGVGNAATDDNQLLDACHRMDSQSAERFLVEAARRSPEDAYNALLRVIEDNTDVHRVVFAHRSWDTLDLVGMEHADTLLRQSLRYCLKYEEYARQHAGARVALPKILEEHKLLGRELGRRTADDTWLESMSQGFN